MKDFLAIIRKSNYCRCSRPVPAPADIPLVEYHSSGGGGDGQQVRFYCFFCSKSQNDIKYFSKFVKCIIMCAGCQYFSWVQKNEKKLISLSIGIWGVKPEDFD